MDLVTDIYSLTKKDILGFSFHGDRFWLNKSMREYDRNQSEQTKYIYSSAKGFVNHEYTDDQLTWENLLDDLAESSVFEWCQIYKFKSEKELMTWLAESL